MRRSGPGWLLAPLLTAFALVGCGDLTSSPEIAGPEVTGPAFAHLPSGESLPALQRRTPLPEDVSVTRNVDPRRGAWISVGAGISFYVPAGAIDTKSLGDGDSGRVPLTVTALAGNALAVGFGPHGLRFRSPAYLVVDVDATAAAEDPALLEELVAIYFEGPADGSVRALEVHPVLLGDRILVVPIHHFSGYFLASG